jgi:hypothetical protein
MHVEKEKVEKGEMMKTTPKKRNFSAQALTSALFRQRKRPSKKLYRRRARTENAGLRDQAGGFLGPSTAVW